jgi:hypothetical protein
VSERICSIPGCSKSHYARGWCMKHWKRWQTHGDPFVDKTRHRSACSIEGCENLALARTWCGRHYQRWTIHGDPLWEPCRQPKVCTVDGCNRDTAKRGWCQAHYQRWQTHGDPLAGGAPRGVLTVEERFWLKVDKNGPVPAVRPDLGPCFLWTDAPNGAGYGTFRIDNDLSVGAHVAALMLDGIEIPAGHEADHLCFVRLCVRRTHLEVVTSAENKRRARARRDVVLIIH